MNVIELLKLYLARSYTKKLRSWGRGTIFFVRMDLILSLSAILSPIAILFSILALSDIAYVVIFIPLLGWCADLFLTRKFSIYDDIEKIKLSKGKIINLSMFIASVIGIIISCQLVIFFTP